MLAHRFLASLSAYLRSIKDGSVPVRESDFAEMGDIKDVRESERVGEVEDER